MSRASVSSLPDRSDPGYAYSVRAAGPLAGRTYLVAAWDGETGALIGRCEIPGAAGAPPALTPHDLLDRMGGRYRLEAVRVDHALDRLSAVTRRIARVCARRERIARRRWRRGAASPG